MLNYTSESMVLQPGEAVAIWIGIVEHVGIVSDLCDEHGRPYVLSCSARMSRGAEETWDVFTGGRKAHKLRRPSNLPAYEVIGRARSMLHKPWNLIDWNCEHFLRNAYGVKSESPQLQFASFVGLIFLTGLLMSGGSQ